MEGIWQIVNYIKLSDIVDIALVAYLFYIVLKNIRNTSAERLLKGIIVLFVIMQLADVFDLRTIHFLITSAMQLGFIAVIIIFQPELRKILERFGKGKFKIFKGKDNKDESLRTSIANVTKAAAAMSWHKIGALVVFERNDKLDNIVGTGTIIDAQITEELTRNIFYPKSPLHDGAVVVSNNRIKAAGCLLPLSSNLSISKELGTRHRAGLGTSETTDAVVLIVSEETGTITLVVNGILKRHLAPETLERLLIKELMPVEDEKTDKKGFWNKFMRDKK
ncbi:MAG: diadenylate cyclase CdaA [Clostridia bacterium]|nr:diadenylate cyclase CdaA [Clostridia bacterium]